jgi:hypothetical protein
MILGIYVGRQNCSYDSKNNYSDSIAFHQPGWPSADGSAT